MLSQSRLSDEMSDWNENDFSKTASEHVRREKTARAILGVDENAEPVEIKKAYWLLAMKYHPDKAPMDEESNKMFHRIQAAYDFLMGKGDGRGLEITKDEPLSEKYNTDNTWGYFLWWRDKYFKDDNNDNEEI